MVTGKDRSVRGLLAVTVGMATNTISLLSSEGDSSLAHIRSSSWGKGGIKKKQRGLNLKYNAIHFRKHEDEFKRNNEKSICI